MVLLCFGANVAQIALFEGADSALLVKKKFYVNLAPNLTKICPK